jgi:histidyl-tRNA synthetase
MSSKIQTLRGMHDILPDQSGQWHWLESHVRSILTGYGYQEIRTPIVEKTDLFKRSIGDVTDIVEKEMYTFSDRNGDSLSLRPEGTASCVRSAIQHGLLHNQQQRLWYLGPMFRHERPQKGRYRQFHQVGVETFGIEGPEVEAELIAMTARLWKVLGIDQVTLELNSLGSPEARLRYRDVLSTYFSSHKEDLDADSLRRLDSNPLRILDSKNPALKPLIEGAPSLADHLDQASVDHFEQLKLMLDAVEISYVVNPRLVRGLDYYSRTVFEWISEDLGSQGAICAGGRYDSLVKQLGGRPVPAVGFAMGIERLLELMNPSDDISAAHRPHAYLVAVGEGAQSSAYVLAERFRSDISGLRLLVNAGAGSFKSQLKRADRSGALVALILGEEEVQNNTISVKTLRESKEPQQVFEYEATCKRLIELIVE